MTQANYDENLILGYVEQTLCDEDIVTFEKQLVADPRLRNLVAQLMADREQLRAMPDVVVPPQLMQHIEEHLERKILLAPPPEVSSESHQETVRWTRADPRQLSQMRMVRMVGYGSLAAMLMVVAGVMYYSSSYRTLEDRAMNHVVALVEPVEQRSELSESSELAASPKRSKLKADLNEAADVKEPPPVLTFAETPAEHELPPRMRSDARASTEKQAKMVGAMAMSLPASESVASLPEDQTRPMLALAKQAKKKPRSVPSRARVLKKRPESVMATSQSSSTSTALKWGQILAESADSPSQPDRQPVRQKAESKDHAPKAQSLAKASPPRLRRSKSLSLVLPVSPVVQKPIANFSARASEISKGMTGGMTGGTTGGGGASGGVSGGATQTPRHADLLCMIKAKDPQIAQKQLLYWAKRHKVRVITSHAASGEVVLSMAAPQLPILIRSLNHRAGQFVQWSNPAPSIPTRAARLKQELPLAPVIPLKGFEDRLTIRIRILPQKPPAE